MSKARTRSSRCRCPCGGWGSRRYGAPAERHLARGHHDGPDLAWVLGSVAPVLASADLALLLVRRRGRRSLLAPRHGRGRLQEGANVQADPGSLGPCHRCSGACPQPLDLGQGNAVHREGVPAMVPASRDPAPLRSCRQVRQHRDHRTAHAHPQERVHEASRARTVPARRLRRRADALERLVQRRPAPRSSRRENSPGGLLPSETGVPNRLASSRVRDGLGGRLVQDLMRSFVDGQVPASSST
jgi:hypothetical protein